MTPRVAVLLLGPPDCGKGTQADQLVSRFPLKHISSGEALRAIAKQQTELADRVRQQMLGGGLVSDQVVNDVVVQALATIGDGQSPVLDGYPRNPDQTVIILKALADLGYGKVITIYLDVPPEICRDRWLHRCHRTHAQGTLREDDAAGEEVFHQRMATFEEHTIPALKCLQQSTEEFRIDGSPAVEIVADAIANCLSKFLPACTRA